MMRLEALSRHDMAADTVRREGLQLRGAAGEHSDRRQGLTDVSVRRRLGLTEADVLTALQRSGASLVAHESLRGEPGEQ